MTRWTGFQRKGDFTVLIAIALLCLYLACLAFFHAGSKRTAFPSIKTNARLQRLMRIAGWGLAALSLMMAIHVSGFERGFPVWLGLFMLAGVVSLLVFALLPKWHIKSLYPIGAACGLFGMFALIGGAA